MSAEKTKKGDPASGVAHAITRFVENPFTNLVKGGVLLVIGLSDASATVRDDVSRGKVRLGHGLIIIGLFGILGALPNLIDALKAGLRFLEHREMIRRAEGEDER